MSLAMSDFGRFLPSAFFRCVSRTLFARGRQYIKIGAVLPVTGKESKIGGAYKQATEFAVKEINDAGGVTSAARR